LAELVTTYSQMARSLIEVNHTRHLSELQLREFIDCMKKDVMKASFVEYLVQQSASKTTIVTAGPTPTPNVRLLGGTFPRVKPLNEKH
jgi:hypothetical protein